MTIENLKNKEIQTEIDQGRVWRAKDFLRQKIRHSEYDETLFSAYADVLSMMHDDLEAGKYYFLSGLRSANQKKKIEIFFERHNYSKLMQLTSQFPYSAQFKRIDDFPNQQVAEDLKLLGLSEPTAAEIRSKESLSGDRFIITLLIIVIFSVPVGIGTIIYWIWKFIIRIIG